MTSSINESLIRRFIARILGNKKRALKQIAAAIGSGQGTLLEGCSGSGIVGWYLKSEGFRVVANDIRLAAYVTARAFIENNATVLSEENVSRLQSSRSTGQGQFQRLFGNILGQKNTEFCDRLASNLQILKGDLERDIAVAALLWVIQRHLLAWHCHPTKDRKALCKTGNFVQYDLEGEWRRFLLEEYAEFLIDNRKENRALNEDALTLAASTPADVAYFDPPYPGTDCSYESSHRLLDQIVRICRGETIADDPWKEDCLKPHQRFGGRMSGLEGIWKLLLRAKHIPKLVISIDSNSCVGIREIELLARTLGYDCEVQGKSVQRPKTEGETQEYILILTADAALRKRNEQIRRELAAKSQPILTQAA